MLFFILFKCHSKKICNAYGHSEFQFSVLETISFALHTQIAALHILHSNHKFFKTIFWPNPPCKLRDDNAEGNEIVPHDPGVCQKL